MAITELEKLEALCHIRACMLRASEYIAGKTAFKRDAVLESLDDGMTETNRLILEIKFRSEQ